MVVHVIETHMVTHAPVPLTTMDYDASIVTPVIPTHVKMVVQVYVAHEVIVYAHVHQDLLEQTVVRELDDCVSMLVMVVVYLIKIRGLQEIVILMLEW